MDKKPIMIILVVLGILACCCLVIAGGVMMFMNQTGSEIDTVFNEIQEGLASTQVASGSTGETIILSDDFSSEKNDWYVEHSDVVDTDYAPGGFSIKILQSDYMAWTNPDMNFTDTVIEIDTEKLGGADDNEFGVFCRYQDAENFYFFTVSSDGYYGINKYVSDELISLGNDGLVPADVIRTGDGSTNHIRAVCNGTQLSLTINGELLLEVQDDSFSSGDIGLYASTYSEPDTEILFSNLVVSEP